MFFSTIQNYTFSQSKSQKPSVSGYDASNPDGIICRALATSGYMVQRGIILYSGGQAFMHDRAIRRIQAVR